MHRNSTSLPAEAGSRYASAGWKALVGVLSRGEARARVSHPSIDEWEITGTLWQGEPAQPPPSRPMVLSGPPLRPRRTRPRRPDPQPMNTNARLDTLQEQVLRLFREVEALKSQRRASRPTDVVDTQTAARIAGRSASTIRRWVREQRLRPQQEPPYDTGTRYTFEVGEVERARDRSSATVIIDLEERVAAIRKRRRQ